MKRCLPLALSLALGCAGGDEDCLTTEQYFARQVWWPVMSSNCIACHNPQGAAKDSKLVLASTWQTGFMQRNLEAVRKVAAFEVGGRSILIEKPLGRLEHGGGARFEEGSDGERALEGLLERFESAPSCDGKAGGGALDGVPLEAPEDTMRRAAIDLAGRLPTAEELSAAPGGLEAAVGAMMAEPAFLERLREVYNDELLTDRYLGGENAINLLTDGDYPTRRWYQAEPDGARRGRLRDLANTAVAREPLELIAHVVKNGRPFTEILTARYRLVNAFSARSYGAPMGAYADGDDPERYDPSVYWEVQLDTPAAGVLTNPIFLNRYPTTATNVNRHRARTVYRLFLATDVMRLAERPVDPTSIEDFNPTLYNPSCAVCHAVIDPVAGAFQNWNERGQYRPPEMGWFQDLRPPGFDGQVLPHDERLRSLPWLGAKVAADRRFATSVVHTWFAALLGREPLAAPAKVESDEERAYLAAYESERAVLGGIADRFVADGHNLRAVIEGLVASPFYRAKAPAAGMSEPEQRALGRARLATPEQLHRKIRAVTGFAWQRNGRNVLLSTDELRIFYGGIDSNQITERIRQPNGIMASIAARMANELACHATARDLVRSAERRLLFPKVELGFTPLGDNGLPVPAAVAAIRENLGHLHLRVLGERAEEAEIDRSYRLFETVWSEGRDRVASGAESVNLAGPCQATRDPDTNEVLPSAARITADRSYVVRAWTAVLAYLLSDYDFLYD